MGALFAGVRVKGGKHLFRPLYLAVTDTALVFHHFSGKGNYDFLLHGGF